MSRDAWPTFWGHNEPLFNAHILAGYSFKHGPLSHFVDSNGDYAPYPKGYITGVGYSDNGTPRPYYASVFLGDGWAQRVAKSRQECIEWALKKAKEVLGNG